MALMISKALGWLCEEPQHSFTLNKINKVEWRLLKFGLARKKVPQGFVFDGKCYEDALAFFSPAVPPHVSSIYSIEISTGRKVVS